MTDAFQHQKLAWNSPSPLVPLETFVVVAENLVVVAGLG
jgi:hypothetical protein